MILIMSGERLDLKILVENVWKQENESVVTRNLLGVNKEIVWSVSIIMKHSTV